MNENRPNVTTTSGPVEGVLENGLVAFRGIPYAAAPVGDLRWRSAQPHAGWSEPRDASSFGATAPQPYMPGGDPIMGGHGEPPFDEDCLTLNITTPGLDGDPRPVLVWIHGGGFLTGSANLPNYDGAEFARDGDLVFVGINYRVGPLGFLEGLGDSNVWLSDQAAALTWIAENIASFGGDPSQITLAGQSGGGFSIGALANHPTAKTLFHRAIVQSPPLGLELHTREQSLGRTKALAAALGHSDIESLRDEPWERLLEGTFAVLGQNMAYGEWTLAYLPVIDPATMPRHPVDVLGETEIDLIVGWTRDEAGFRFGLDPSVADTTLQEVVAWAAKRHGDHANDLAETYRVAHPDARPVDVLTDLLSDDLFRMGCLDVLESRANEGRPAYAYQFEFAPASHGGSLGSPHCFDLPFTFGNFANWSHAPFVQGLDESVRDQVSSTIHDAFVSFVRRGVPEHAGLRSWPTYDASDRTVLLVDEQTRAASDPVKTWREAQSAQ